VIKFRCHLASIADLDSYFNISIRNPYMSDIDSPCSKHSEGEAISLRTGVSVAARVNE